ncbi:MAG: Flp family type IVb pilin [Gemmatales bacterium]|nr:Flp family type IVb pilin [Gemmatales bacterium]MDW8176382.1 Flp family type IVb pilin [Gemmatales bacterium]
MRSVVHAVKRFVVSEDGPTAVEYAVMLALIVVVCIAAITALGQSARGKFQQVSDTISSVQPQ